MIIIWILTGVAIGAALYRLGLADGLSVSRRGRLMGARPEKEDSLLKRIEAYSGRKEQYDR